MSKTEKTPPNNSIWIFLGPSLPRARAQSTLAAHYAPPIRRGDLDKAYQNGAKTIGIIDGVFYRSFSVSSFEILPLLEKGIKIFGASSMGALKAVECELFGMQGVGQIFQWYRSGKIEAEDEVALVFDPKTFKPISEPLVNMRYAFALAAKEGIISMKEKKDLLRMAKRLYFPERSYERLFREARERGYSTESLTRLRSYVFSPQRDLKSLDAIKCLQTIGTITNT